MSPDLSRSLDRSAHKMFPDPPTSSQSQWRMTTAKMLQRHKGQAVSAVDMKSLSWLLVHLAQSCSDSAPCCQASCDDG